MRLRSLGLTAATLLLLTLTGCGSDDDAGSDGATSDAVTCTYTSDGQPAARDVDLPPSTPTHTDPVDATIETSAGTLKVTLSADTTPCTVNSFVSLAQQGFYDKTPCPRITTYDGFQLLQCGDPTGTRGGGPGYEFDDELTGDETYPAGTLAMANSGEDTNGSQFFIVYGDTSLDPAYTVFGRVTDGLDAIVQVGKDGATPADDGTPNTPVDITKVTIG